MDIHTEQGRALAAKQTPGGPLIAERHFQSDFGMWTAGGAFSCDPYFFAIGTLNEVKREARAAGYTSLTAYNTVSHRTTKVKQIPLRVKR
jgi:hypothetical protein